jgi:hypothetical protein
MTRRFRAPAADRAVLADPPFEQIPALVDRNRRLLDRDDVRIGGVSLRELRRQARRDVLNDTSGSPLLVAGHQPELSHPGVWVKNFALNGMAKKLGGVPLHLVADHDTMKSATISIPTWDEWKPESVRLEAVPFDDFAGEQPWETRAVRNPAKWGEFVRRVAEAAKRWGYEPLLCGLPRPGGERSAGALPSGSRQTGFTWADQFTTLRQQVERTWGCDNRELAVSAVSTTDAFRRFVRHVAADDDRFRHAYNSAVQQYRDAYGLRSRSHPVPDLHQNELPFWVVEGTSRRAATTADTGLSLRPRALTLTLFARLCLGDLFVHGIGGGKYDEVTDAIIRDYFGVEPPAYQVLSATLHLPLPHFPATAADVHRLQRKRRDLDWQPERFIDPREATDLKRRKAELSASVPTGRAERRTWFRELQQVTQEMRPFVEHRARDVDRELERVTAEVAANAVLRRRDFAWVLYPEQQLREFLQQFV